MSNIYIENLIKNNMRLLRLCEDDPDTSRVKLDAVQSKVLEYLRQIQVRCPVPLPGGEVCKINICIQLACAKYVMMVMMHSDDEQIGHTC